MSDPIVVVFKNTTGLPVSVQVTGSGSGSSSAQLFSGTISGDTGYIEVPSGYSGYSCTAIATWQTGVGTRMNLPVIRQNANVSVVFASVEGVEE